jgi:flavin reductase (DIM6/NTAB) family NADH-FMN oxidoreductase RutF
MTPPASDDRGHIEGFDGLVRDLDPPMLIVTTATADTRGGCLVGFHSQCGIESRQYAVWISKANRTHAIASSAEVFAVHVLDSTHHALAELFGGQTGDEIDKFALCAWTEGPGGVPLLDECPNRFVAQSVSFTEVGADHSCLVLAPTRTERGPRLTWLTQQKMNDVTAGHATDEPPHPD